MFFSFALPARGIPFPTKGKVSERFAPRGVAPTGIPYPPRLGVNVGAGNYVRFAHWLRLRKRVYKQKWVS